MTNVASGFTKQNKKKSKMGHQIYSQQQRPKLLLHDRGHIVIDVSLDCSYVSFTIGMETYTCAAHPSKVCVGKQWTYNLSGRGSKFLFHLSYKPILFFPRLSLFLNASHTSFTPGF